MIDNKPQIYKIERYNVIVRNKDGLVLIVADVILLLKDDC